MPHRQTYLTTVLARQLQRRLYTTTTSAASKVKVAEPVESSLQSLPTCPPPTCPCAATPEGLDIDRKKPMTIPPYVRHVVIRTGRNDWASRIEDEESSVLGDVQEGKPRANLAKSLKALIGPGGKYYNPSRNVLITNGSMPPSTKVPNRNGVHIYPSSIYVPDLNNTPQAHELFVRHFLMEKEEREKLDRIEALVGKNIAFHEEQIADGAAQSASKVPRTSPGIKKGNIQYHLSDAPSILVCTHNSRDSRCGTLGPILKQAFRDYIALQFNKNTKERTPEGELIFHMKSVGGFNINPAYRGISVHSISHVGGHAWAGNVIIYIPPKYKLEGGKESPLAGKGMWYGRVEPKHVEGIVEETIKGGRIIEDILRGVHSQPRIPGILHEGTKDR